MVLEQLPGVYEKLSGKVKNKRLKILGSDQLKAKSLSKLRSSGVNKIKKFFCCQKKNFFCYRKIFLLPKNMFAISNKFTIRNKFAIKIFFFLIKLNYLKKSYNNGRYFEPSSCRFY